MCHHYSLTKYSSEETVYQYQSHLFSSRIEERSLKWQSQSIPLMVLLAKVGLIILMCASQRPLIELFRTSRG